MIKGNPNPVFYQDEILTIILLNYKGTELLCFISTKSYDKVNGYHWYAKLGRHTYYAWAYTVKADGTQRQQVFMHRLLLPAIMIDHKDGNGLNNLDDNLRPATVAQNAVN